MAEQDITIIRRPISELIEAEYNPRKITDRQFSQLKDSLKRFGFVDPVLVNMHPERANIIIGGHMRTKAAEALGYTEVPCVELNLTLEQEKELNIRLNKSGGTFDFDMLANYFEQDELLEWGFEDFEFGVDEVTELPAAEEGEVNLDPPKEPITVLGDLYELNGHRLHCASSTDVDAVDKLMNGKTPDLVHTDPPYGMSAVSKSGVLSERYKTDILGDDNPDVAKDAFNLASSLWQCKMIWWGANYYSSCLPDSECWIVWDKNNGASDQTDCELAWANYRSVVRQFTRASDKINRAHPTEKPVQLHDWVFERWGDGVKLVVDLFLGGGSCLIGAEKNNKTCYGQELDPKFCDVIVRRWVKYMQDNSRPYTVKRNGQQLAEAQIQEYFA